MARGPRQEHIEKTVAEQAAMDAEVTQEQKITDHEIREFPISVIVEKFNTGLDTDSAELFIPDYQREYIWTSKQKSRFIESLLLNLPIPYIFVADIGKGDNEGRLEIVDGSQRIRTLHKFMNNEFALENLKKLPSANGFKFSDFSQPRKLRFARKTIRMIELTEFADEDTRREIFDRLNTGGITLTTMEQRQGRDDGPFLDFLHHLSENPVLREICPLGRNRQDRAEYLELILRYFAYAERYQEFRKSVDDFLTQYLKDKNENFDASAMSTQFNDMCNFVRTNFDNGFRKTAGATTVPRIRFEAISVGSTLALNMNRDLTPSDTNEWINSIEFITHTRSDASNSRPKVKGRIEYVRDKLLGQPHLPEVDTVDNDEGEEV